MTKKFMWNDDYSINNEELDNHHQVLIDIFNRLYDKCLENDTNSSLDKIINELIDYTKYHFTAEELYMMNTGYEHVDKHIFEHTLFTDLIVDLKKDYNINHREQINELVVSLGIWLLNHVIVEDKKLSVVR